jgi:hypothetical protein
MRSSHTSRKRPEAPWRWRHAGRRARPPRATSRKGRKTSVAGTIAPPYGWTHRWQATEDRAWEDDWSDDADRRAHRADAGTRHPQKASVSVYATGKVRTGATGTAEATGATTTPGTAGGEAAGRTEACGTDSGSVEAGSQEPSMRSSPSRGNTSQVSPTCARTAVSVCSQMAASRDEHKDRLEHRLPPCVTVPQTAPGFRQDPHQRVGHSPGVPASREQVSEETGYSGPSPNSDVGTGQSAKRQADAGRNGKIAPAGCTLAVPPGAACRFTCQRNVVECQDDATGENSSYGAPPSGGPMATTPATDQVPDSVMTRLTLD